ncbi:hypothetical protein GCM10009765_38400 [Fodinicola feengrottensis]|uniref:Ricin B lectin domain-containing protein n=2 Tax=Fodinicola feengrottensis TaxID=435914 RepID=A0ABN2HCR5_9ACTN
MLIGSAHPRGRLLLAIGLTALFVCGFLTNAAKPAGAAVGPADSDYYEIPNSALPSAPCLQEGANHWVQVATCDPNNAAQQWATDYDSPYGIMFRNRVSGLCLGTNHENVLGGGVNDEYCESDLDELWGMTEVYHATYQIVNQASGGCLENDEYQNEVSVSACAPKNLGQMWFWTGQSNRG